jgi:hypothetical protein
VVDDDATTIQFPHRVLRDRRGGIHPLAKPDDRLSVTIRDDETPWPLRLYFASFAPDAPLIGVEFGDECSRSELDLATVERIARNLPFYEQYARAMIQWDDGKGDAEKALAMLSYIGAGRRSLPRGFFQIVAADYNTRRRAGETAPITAIARSHGVYKSTAGRWVAEARRRGLIKEDG